MSKLSLYDGRITGNGQKETPYRIWADYYYYAKLDSLVSSCLLDALNEYNNNGGPWEIPFDGTTVYVKFELHAIPISSLDFKDQANNDIDTIGKLGNWITIGTPSTRTAWGSTSELGIILNYGYISSEIEKTIKKDDINYKKKFIRAVFVHEIGHSLGGIDGDPGAMGNIDPPQTSLSTVTADFIRILLLRVNMHHSSALDKDLRFRDSLIVFCNRFSAYQKQNKDGGIPLPPDPRWYGTVGTLLSDGNFTSFPNAGNSNLHSR